MSQNETLKIAANTDTLVEFLYDEPKTGTNNYGQWFLYGVKNEGQEKGIFATEALHKKIQFYRKGDKVNIRKEEYEPGKFGWNVIPEEGTSPKSETNSTSKLDDRTHDIHKQVCLKLAVSMMQVTDTILTEAQIVTIDANMRHLMCVLEGSPPEETESDMPF
tara:strand:+ start:1181 stop:1666 length:486 start_codon:yes stop_codon:yes gene_type:complete